MKIALTSFLLPTHSKRRRESPFLKEKTFSFYGMIVKKKSSHHRDESSRENCYLRSENESKIVRGTQRMGYLEVCPLTFKQSKSEREVDDSHKDSSFI
jgi:hypothetical protein